MWGLASTQPVSEYEASGEIERIYHEIRQTLRVSGVNLNFRTWAAEKNLLPVLWDAIKPPAVTLAFEEAADQLRATAAASAVSLGPLQVVSVCHLGPSQQFHVQEMLKLYHYINPKLLLLTAGVHAALLNPHLQAANSVSSHSGPQITPGIPPRMMPLEMEEESPENGELQSLFRDICDTLALKSVNSDYRSLALWPEYLAAAWVELKPRVLSEEFRTAADRLRQQAEALAVELPQPIQLESQILTAAGADLDQARESAADFLRILPPLILNIALCLHDWLEADALDQSPYPADIQTLQHSHSPGAAQ